MNDNPMKNPNPVSETIKYVSEVIHRSLNFVETKHAGLIAVNSGGLFGVLSFHKDISSIFHFTMGVVLLLLLVSIGISLISFYPIKRTRKVQPNKNPNPFYSEGLSRMTRDDFKTMTAQSEVVDDHLLVWTHNVAGVAARKYRFFRVAVGLTTASIVVILFAALCYIINFYLI